MQTSETSRVRYLGCSIAVEVGALENSFLNPCRASGAARAPNAIGSGQGFVRSACRSDARGAPSQSLRRGQRLWINGPWLLFRAGHDLEVVGPTVLAEVNQTARPAMRRVSRLSRDAGSAQLLTNTGDIPPDLH